LKASAISTREKRPWFPVKGGYLGELRPSLNLDGKALPLKDFLGAIPGIVAPPAALSKK